MPTSDNQHTITRHVCPRNCYDACSILGYTQNGVLKKVEGDPNQTYTNGKLCVKGYSYVNRVYHPDRIKTPMIQSHRGSGKWQEISWDYALDIIAKKILSLHQQYGSHLSLALNKYSGNFGILHNAVEGMFNSLGPTTQAVGSPCWSAGLDAHYYDFGNYLTSNPADMASSQVIVLWGVNPAWTAVHSMPYIYQAKDKGATIITIDPIYTTTAKKSTLYVQISPGSDLYLALAIAKIIYDNEWYDKDFINKHTFGWDAYCASLANLDLSDLAEKSGQSIDCIQKLAEVLSSKKPVLIWTGFGLQRHLHGGQTIRAINSIVAMTGNLGLYGGGVHFAQQQTWNFNYHILMKDEPYNCRPFDINNFTNELQRMQDTPIKLLWVSCRNMLTQSPSRKSLIRELNNIDLIVTVDQFLTPTAQYSDIVLPTTTQFEEWDIVASYWHHWIAINQPAIEPYYESKSELVIAQMLSEKLNQIQPGTSRFPTSLTVEEWIDREFNPSLYQQLGITHWRELLDGPKKANLPPAWNELRFNTPSEKFEFYSERALKNNLPPLATIVPNKPLTPTQYPYWLLSPHAQFSLNSQFQNLPWIQKLGHEPVVIIHPTLAHKENLQNGTIVKVRSQNGEFISKIKISHDVAPGIVLFYQGWYPNSNIFVNDLVAGDATDMGVQITGSQGVAFHNTFVSITQL